MQKTNRSKLLSLVLTLAIVMSLFAGLTLTASAAYSGDWTASGNYNTSWYNANSTSLTLSNAADLAGFAYLVNNGNTFYGKTISLTANATYNLDGHYWIPIGVVTIASNSTTSSPYVSSGGGFAGTFSGNNASITNMCISNSASGTGFFGYIAPDGVVQNVSVTGSVTVSGTKDAVGGIAGYNSGTINKVTNNVSVSAGSTYNVGGIAGFNDNYYMAGSKGVILNSKNTVAINGMNKVGGITGENSGTILSCSNSGSITGTNAGSKNGIGGIAGRNGNNNTAKETGIIRDCFNAGSVGSSGQKWTGGMTGFNNAKSQIINCYNYGIIVAGAGYNNPIAGNQEAPSTKVYGNYSLNTLNATGNTVEETGIRRPELTTVIGGVLTLGMKTAEFAGILETAALGSGIWDGADGSYPWLTNGSVDPKNDNTGTTNNYAIVYIKSNGDDTKAGNSSTDAVQTLAKAVAIADASTNSGVYIHVVDTITVSNTQDVFGQGTKVKWYGSAGSMFNIGANGKLTIGGIAVDGMGIGTIFSVSGDLTVRNNASVTNGGIAIDVLAGGDLRLNRSSITGTTNSVKLNSSTSTFSMYAATGQTPAHNIVLTGAVYLATNSFISIGSAITNTITVDMQTSTVNTVVAKVQSPYTAFSDGSGGDLGKFLFGTHTFKRVPLYTYTQIQIAT